MKHIGIFFEIILIFLVVLLFSGIVYLFNTDVLTEQIKKFTSTGNFFELLYKNLLRVYKYLILFSLFITFSMFYSFIDLRIYNVKSFGLAILAVPLIICSIIFYLENYYLGSLTNSRSILSVFITPFSNISQNSIIYYPVKIYYLSFLIFIVVPGAVLLNNRGWYLKTVLFLIFYLALSLFLFKYFNRFVLHLFRSIRNFKGFPPSNELILTILYIPFGILILSLADSIRKIKPRIDIGKVKKIQH
ncbi:MAG: hypothetical protein KKH98_10035 [Spirochaetes bacterium]|nr:hypothetical protein [Spirochaetota bacterium]